MKELGPAEFAVATGLSVKALRLRILAVAAGRRRLGIGRALLRAFEASALRLGATRISLGADAEACFYVRHGYQTMLLLQWAYDPGRAEAEVAALAAGPVRELTWHRGVIQRRAPVVRGSRRTEPGRAGPGRGPGLRRALGYCMTKAIA